MPSEGWLLFGILAFIGGVVATFTGAEDAKLGVVLGVFFIIMGLHKRSEEKATWRKREWEDMEKAAERRAKGSK